VQLRRYLAVFGLALCGGCGSDLAPSSRLVGVWQYRFGHADSISMEIRDVGGRHEGVACMFVSGFLVFHNVPVTVNGLDVSFSVSSEHLTPRGANAPLMTFAGRLRSANTVSGGSVTFDRTPFQGLDGDTCGIVP
jgi:hypothetical protein